MINLELREQRYEKIKTAPKELTISRDFFNPSRFELRDLASENRTGWEKDIQGIGPVTFAPLNHAHQRVEGMSHMLSFMQQKIFDITNPQDILPTHLLGIPQCIVAYKSGQFTPEGAVGFGFAFGGDQTKSQLQSKAAGVMPEYQGKAAIGWYIQILQAHMALENEITNVMWSMNPLRGATAKLLISKLGGVGTIYSPKKAGLLDSSKGTPSHKINVEWNLISPDVHRRIDASYDAIQNGISFEGRSLEEFEGVPQVNTGNIDLVDVRQNPLLLCKIPKKQRKGSFITDDSPVEHELGLILSGLLDTKDADVPQTAATDPASVRLLYSEGNYTIADLVSVNKGENFDNYYILKRKSPADK